MIDKFCPIYYFDKNEKYLPIDFNKYVNNNTIDNNIVNCYIKNYNNLIYIYYWSFYLYDTGKTIFKINSHKYDIELVILEIKDDKINRVCFCPHGQTEHFWLSIEDTKSITENNKIKVYVSNGKHASYPIPGTIWRYYGFANDVNNSKYPIYIKPVLLTDNSINSELFKYKRSFIEKNIDIDIPCIALKKIRKRYLFKKIYNI